MGDIDNICLVIGKVERRMRHILIMMSVMFILLSGFGIYLVLVLSETGRDVTQIVDRDLDRIIIEMKLMNGSMERMAGDISYIRRDIVQLNENMLEIDQRMREINYRMWEISWRMGGMQTGLNNISEPISIMSSPMKMMKSFMPW